MSQLLKRVVLSRLVCYNSVRTFLRIKTKDELDAEGAPPRPPPWDYAKKGYNYWHYVTDWTYKRITDNTKVIAVEGPIGAGKTAVIRELAKIFDFKAFPEANLDMIYVDEFGFDLRKCDPFVPENTRTFDVDNFMRRPHHCNSTTMQFHHLYIKLSLYVDTITHLLNTGQGVICDRTPWSDFVFIKTMFKAGYVNENAYNLYITIRSACLYSVLRPHIIIYLDMPVDDILENVRQRDYCYERDSPVLTREYLQTMEHIYKNELLPGMGQYCDVFIHDWSKKDGQDIDLIVENICSIDYDTITQFQKNQDWRYHDALYWNDWRYDYTERKTYYMARYTSGPFHEIPELWASPRDERVNGEIIKSMKPKRYQKGYNPQLGDRGHYFLKFAPRAAFPLPLCERRPPPEISFYDDANCYRAEAH